MRIRADKPHAIAFNIIFLFIFQLATTNMKAQEKPSFQFLSGGTIFFNSVVLHPIAGIAYFMKSNTFGADLLSVFSSSGYLLSACLILKSKEFGYLRGGLWNGYTPTFACTETGWNFGAGDQEEILKNLYIRIEITYWKSHDVKALSFFTALALSI